MCLSPTVLDIAAYSTPENEGHPSVDLTNTDLGENVQILENATIEDATITDSVIFPETTIKHSELRRSLIDTDTHLESLNLSGAVIGAHTQLNGD